MNMKKWPFSFAYAVAIYQIAGSVSASMLTLADTSMQPTNWSVISKFNTVTISSDLIVNEGALKVSTSSQLWAAVYKTDLSWVPAQLGSMLNIAGSTDVVVNSGVTFAPVLIQNGNIYAPPGVPPYFIEPQNFNVNQGLSWNIPIGTFGKEVGNGPGTPDFSTGASPIFFGIAGRRDAGGATYR